MGGADSKDGCSITVLKGYLDSAICVKRCIPLPKMGYKNLNEAFGCLHYNEMDVILHDFNVLRSLS